MVTMGEFIRDTLVGPEEVDATGLTRDELVMATRAGSKEAGLQLLRSLAPKRSLDARHLPGKHDQKTHGHGGEAADKAPLTDVQYQQLKPQPWNPDLANGVEVELDTFGNAAGRSVIKLADEHAGSFGGCEQLSIDTWKLVNKGTTGNKKRDREIRDFLDAARHTPKEMVPEKLYRGMAIPDSLLEAFTDEHRKGAVIELSTSSFSSKRRVGEAYAKGELGFQGRGGRPVIVEFDTSNGAQALPIQNLMRDRIQHLLGEYVVAGHFEVTDNVKWDEGSRAFILKLRQTGAI